MEHLIHRDEAYLLRRFPLKKDDRLRAWDAADEYLLRYLDGDAEPDAPAVLPSSGEIVLINDTFGALGVALHQRQPQSWGDSFLGHEALRYNLYENQLIEWQPTLVPADKNPSGAFALAVIKFPKNLTFFEDQLLRLRNVLAPEAHVVCGGMIKHTPKRAYQLLEKVIGPTVTTQGWKKARLAHSQLADRTDLPAGVPPTTYNLPGSEQELLNLPNVFSRERPDAGTRLLLANLPHLADELAAVDLGCGNGILALALARNCPQARILGVDESYQAVASAHLNAANLGDDSERLTFYATDGLAGEPDQSRDLVVCNPPFHQGQTTGDLPAWDMFAEAARVLRPGGELRVVGNRHLGYHAKLKRLFEQVQLVASDSKFVVLSAVKSNSRL